MFKIVPLKLLHLVVLVVSIAVIVVAANSGDDEEECSSIYDIICGNMPGSDGEPLVSASMDDFCNLIDSMDTMRSVLDGGSSTPITVFAPNDDAFNNIMSSPTADYELEDLENILMYHVTAGGLSTEDMECKIAIEMNNGKDARIMCNQEDLPAYIKGVGNSREQLPTFMESYQAPCNEGFVYIIDQVLLPTKEDDNDSNDVVDNVDESKEKTIFIIRHGEKVWVPTNTTAYKYACLSEQGWARAYNMNFVFGPTPNQTVLKTPDALFSFNYDDGTLDCRTSRGFYRTQAVIAPLGQTLGIEIDNSTGSKPDLCGPEFGTLRGNCSLPTPSESVNDYGPCCNVAAAAQIKSVLMEDGIDSILCSWEHSNIAYLANALGSNNCTDSKITTTSSNKTGITNLMAPDCNMTWLGTDFDSVWALYFDAETGEFLRLDTNLQQEFEWIGPTEPGLQDYNLGPGEKPGVD